MALALCAAVLAGCSATDDGGHGEARPERTGTTAAGVSPEPAPASASAARTGAATPAPRFRADPARLPTTRAAALDLVRAVAAGPDNYGPGYEKRSPYESDPADRPVLGVDCVWRQAKQPDDILAGLTRYSRLPASGGRGEVRLSATVTVHRTAAQADLEIAETLEEALRCPDQQLRESERISGLNSIGSGYGANGNTSADDSLMEMGSYLAPALGDGPTPYFWNQVRLGPVTLAVAVQGGRGVGQNDLLTTQARAVAEMETAVRTRLGGQG
ncbi:hypothetical protein ACGFRG_19680 [Streptomyces sp. NPDC048696]|uniref:hypothetical protein n=1 Tax=Streptomyces sp. NPDC048696 TaxID=3365585 RepID=UPI003717E169